MRKRTKRGHTLIEVMLASFMALTCAMVFAATIPTANTSRVKSDLNNRATSLAQKQMESVKSLGFANVTAQQLFDNGLITSTTPVTGSTYDWSTIDNAELDSPATVLPGGQARITITQERIDLRRVTVIVTWTERQQARQTVVSTLVANL